MTTGDGETIPDRARRRLVVSGLVQGVGFRVATLQSARVLGIAGWVRNTPDGRVECVAEGSESALASLEAFLSAGPPGAVVASVDSRPESPAGLDGFRIAADADRG